MAQEDVTCFQSWSNRDGWYYQVMLHYHETAATILQLTSVLIFGIVIGFFHFLLSLNNRCSCP